MRTNRAILTIGACVAAMTGSTALADAPAQTDEQAAKRLPRGAHVFPQPRRAASVVAETSRKVRAERRESRGPVHPLLGTPDYGTAENAFGAARSGHMHSGQDVFAPTGTPLVAVADSIVIDAGTDGGQGNYVHLYDEREDRTYVYMHMVAPASVSTGEHVTAGQRLGGVGCTGSCWGEHLHFEVREGRGWGGEPIDPMPLLQEWPQA